MEEKMKLVVLFWKDDNFYKYACVSLAIKRVDEFELVGPVCNGEKLESMDKIVSSPTMLFENDIAKIRKGKKLSNYAYYEVPEYISDTIAERYSEKPEVALEFLNELCHNIQIVHNNENVYSQILQVRHIEVEKNNKMYKNMRDNHQSTNEVELVENSKKINISDVDVNSVITDIKEKFIGQDEAVEAIVSNIYANQRIIETGNNDLISTQKAAILIDGPTGTGKTAILKEISDKFSLPMYISSSTSYSTTGYVGDKITDILVKLYKQTDGDIEKAEKGIVCIDEIDKLGGVQKEKELVMRRGVQQELLSFISGGKYNIQPDGPMGPSYEFDTSKLTFICVGAFTNLRDKKIHENENVHSKRNPIGFQSVIEPEKVEEIIPEKTYKIDAQDYIDYGLERELVGRFSLMTFTKEYSVDDYKNILLKSKISPLKTFIEFAKSFGVMEVFYSDEFIEKVAQMAYNKKFGARGLQQIISDLKNLLLLDIINSKSESIELTIEMLNLLEQKNIRKY